MKKNRIFFFTAYDGFRKHTLLAAGDLFAAHASRAQRRFQRISHRHLRSADHQLRETARARVSRSRIPDSRQPHLTHLQVLRLVPFPARPTRAFRTTILAIVPIGFNNNNTTNKVDLNLSDRHRFYAMYSHGSKK